MKATYISSILMCLLIAIIGNTAMSETNPKVQFETSKGNIVIELDAENAPLSVENFITYVKSGHYDGTIFHRVIPSFMIQGGGFDIDMKQKSTNATIQNEANNGIKNVKGSISMARTSAPHSASSQFFINVTDNSMLDFTSESPQGWGYAVFGQVVEGLDIVLTIEEVATGNQGGHQDVPLEPVVINKATLLEQ
jgi:peptidyl-prolyl cis-trans isomerase B (cyclophilin B)|tara:strand:- start:1378 stop:1959 length:582 start_codon:yes stop_codon:yes gene_type:complete